MSSLPPLLPVQHPQQQLTSSRGKEKPDRRGREAQGQTGKDIRERETAAQQFQALLTTGCKKPDGSGRPSRLTFRGGAWRGQPRAHPVLARASLWADYPPLQRLCSSPPSSHQTPPHSQEGLVPIWGAPATSPNPWGRAPSPPPHISLPGWSTNGATFADRPRRFLSADKIWIRGLGRLTPVKSSSTTDISLQWGVSPSAGLPLGPGQAGDSQRENPHTVVAH